MRLLTFAIVVSLLVSLDLARAVEFFEPGAVTTVLVTQLKSIFLFLKVDVKVRQIRVECEALRVENLLEFFLCLAGTTEHESVLWLKVRLSHVHVALLMLGLKLGESVRFSEVVNKWLPLYGLLLQLSVEFVKDGKIVTLLANRLMREVKSNREMLLLMWIFVGSKMIDDTYAVDRIGYLVSFVNFELIVIDILKLASNANETLMWETNIDLMPKEVGAVVTLIIEPVGKVVTGNGNRELLESVDQLLVAIDVDGNIQVDGASVNNLVEVVERLRSRDKNAKFVRVAVVNSIEQNAIVCEVMNALSVVGLRFLAVPQVGVHGATLFATRDAEAPALSGEVQADEALIRRLRAQWDQSVAPHSAGLREVVKIHYDVIVLLRREQQRLVDEVDKIQRLIDDLEKQYQDLTTLRLE